MRPRRPRGAPTAARPLARRRSINLALSQNLAAIRRAERWNQIVDRCHASASEFASIKLDNFLKLEPNSTGNLPDDWECPFLVRGRD